MYTYTTQAEIRTAFWEEYPHLERMPSQIVRPSKPYPMHQKSPALIQYQQEKQTRQLVTLAAVFLALCAILAARLAYLATN
jgi:hypothetical protein